MLRSAWDVARTIVVPAVGVVAGWLGLAALAVVVERLETGPAGIVPAQPRQPSSPVADIRPHAQVDVTDAAAGRRSVGS